MSGEKHSTPRISPEERERIQRERAAENARKKAQKEAARKRKEENDRRERERREQERQKHLAHCKMNFRAEASKIEQTVAQTNGHPACDVGMRIVLAGIQSDLSGMKAGAEGCDNEYRLSLLQKKMNRVGQKVSEVKKLLDRRAALVERIKRCHPGRDSIYLQRQLDRHLLSVKDADEWNLSLLEKHVGAIEREVAEGAGQRAKQDQFARVEANFNAIDKVEASMDAVGYMRLQEDCLEIKRKLRTAKVTNMEQELASLDAKITAYRETVHTRYDVHQSAMNRVRMLCDRLEMIKAQIDPRRHVGDLRNASILESHCRNLQDKVNVGRLEEYESTANGLDEKIERLGQKMRCRIALDQQAMQLEQAAVPHTSLVSEDEEYDTLKKNAEELSTKIEQEDLKDFGPIAQHIDDLQGRIQNHIENRKERYRTELQDRLFELEMMQADESVSKWPKPKRDLQSVGKALVQIGIDLDKPGYGDAEHRLEEAKKELDRITAEVEEIQLKEAYRQFIVDGFKTVLGNRKMGFVGLETTLKDSEDASSAILITVRRDPEKKILVLVTHEDEKDVGIRYILDGYDNLQEYHQGKLYRVCPASQTQLQEIHKQIKKIGIEMSPPYWRDMPPHDLEARADALPRDEQKSISKEF